MLCIEIGRAGKHFLGEIPLSRLVMEATSSLETLNKAASSMQILVDLPFVPAIRQTKQLVDTGAWIISIVMTL